MIQGTIIVVVTVKVMEELTHKPKNVTTRHRFLIAEDSMVMFKMRAEEIKSTIKNDFPDTTEDVIWHFEAIQ